MRSTHTREQDFMAITAEVEVLCQQLKGRGMYTVPPTSLITSGPKAGSNVHFQPIDPAQKSSVQTMDQLLLNSSLNLLDDSPRSQSSSSNGQIPCGQVTSPGSTHKGSYPIPPTPYINQTAVDQHMGTQHTPISPRMSTGPMNLQSPKQVRHHEYQTAFNGNDCPSSTHCRHLQKIILLTVQIHLPCTRPGLKVQISKALSRVHQDHLRPQRQREGQDLFVGTVEK